MNPYRYHILVIKNRLSFEPDLQGVAKYLREKTQLEPVIQVMDVDVPLEFEPFLAADGRGLFGLHGIKQKLRDTKKIGYSEYNSILFFFDQTESPEPGKTPGRTYPNDLEGAVFSEIPTQPGLVQMGDTLRLTLHEMVHQFHFLASKKGYPTTDDMDRYDKDFEPYAPDGNFARNLARLQPFWRVISELATPTIAELLKEIARLIGIRDTLLEKLRGSKLEKFCDAIQAFEGYFAPSPEYPNGSASWKNRNPGNLRYTGYTASLGATGISPSGFAIFPTYEKGREALRQLLRDAAAGKLIPYRKDNLTLLGFFEIYAPKEDSNQPNEYAAFIAKKLGVSVDTLFKSLV